MLYGLSNLILVCEQISIVFNFFCLKWKEAFYFSLYVSDSNESCYMGSGIYIALLANYIGYWVILLLLLFFFLWKWFLSYLAYNKRGLLFFSINVSVSSEKVRCYVYNIFTINHRWLIVIVVISSNFKLTLKLLFCPIITCHLGFIVKML